MRCLKETIKEYDGVKQTKVTCFYFIVPRHETESIDYEQ